MPLSVVHVGSKNTNPPGVVCGANESPPTCWPYHTDAPSETSRRPSTDPRASGAGHYNRFTGSLKIGLNGIISFGSRPLQLMSIVGFIVAGLSFLLGAWYVVGKLAGIDYTPGLPTTVLVVTFFSGVQLLSLGLMGEYVGRIYDEVKRRPKYIIDRKIERPLEANGDAQTRAPSTEARG